MQLQHAVDVLVHLFDFEFVQYILPSVVGVVPKCSDDKPKFLQLYLLMDESQMCSSLGFIYLFFQMKPEGSNFCVFTNQFWRFKETQSPLTRVP